MTYDTVNRIDHWVSENWRNVVDWSIVITSTISTAYSAIQYYWLVLSAIPGVVQIGLTIMGIWSIGCLAGWL